MLYAFGSVYVLVSGKFNKDMNNLEEHEAMDIILKYLIDNKSDKPIHSRTIWKNLFPGIDEIMVYFLLERIMRSADSIVTTVIRDQNLASFDVFFNATALTEIYLNKQGGFTRQFEIEQLKEQEEIRLVGLNNVKLEAEIDIIKFQKGLNKRLTIWGLVVAIVSILTSILIAVNSSQPPAADTSQLDSLSVRLKNIEIRLQILEQKKLTDISRKN